jgi:excisionase family DNA binding protein
MKLKPSYQIDDDRFLTIPEAAEIASVGRRRIYVAVLEYELPVVRLGPKTKRIKLSELRKWIASKTTKVVAR